MRWRRSAWVNQTVATVGWSCYAGRAKLDRMSCCATFAGQRKEIRPQQAIALKRDLGEIMNVRQPDAVTRRDVPRLPSVHGDRLFDVYASVDVNAPLRAQIATVLEIGATWSSGRNHDRLFQRHYRSTIGEVHAAYDTLGQRFRVDLYVTQHRASPPKPPPAVWPATILLRILHQAVQANQEPVRVGGTPLPPRIPLRHHRISTVRRLHVNPPQRIAATTMCSSQRPGSIV